MLRYEHEYYNFLLVEQPNENFGHTIVRQFLYDAFNLLQYDLLTSNPDEILKSIAIKTMKEVKYHYRYSSEWVIRLGDGTETSHDFVQTAVNDLWKYTGEFFKPASYETASSVDQAAIDVKGLQPDWEAKTSSVFQQAGLDIPKDEVFLFGGKEGRHTEHLGYILAELQYMQRTYPSMKW